MAYRPIPAAIGMMLVNGGYFRRIIETVSDGVELTQVQRFRVMWLLRHSIRHMVGYKLLHRLQLEVELFSTTQNLLQT